MSSKSGFLRVSVGVPVVKVASCSENVHQIVELMELAHTKKVSLISFPELSLSSHSCGDLFSDTTLLNQSVEALNSLLESTKHLELVGVVGMPLVYNGSILNTAITFLKGKILGVTPKKTAGISRYFASFNLVEPEYITICGQTGVPLVADMTYLLNDTSFTVEFAEDTHVLGAKSSNYSTDFVVTLSAQSEIASTSKYYIDILKSKSLQHNVAFLYSTSGFGESTTDQVPAAKSFIVDSGELLAQSNQLALTNQMVVSELDIAQKRSLRLKNNEVYQSVDRAKTVSVSLQEESLDTLYRPLRKNLFLPSDSSEYAHFVQDTLNLQALALAKRLLHTHTDKVVLGVSGGLDSTIALLVCQRAFEILSLPSKNIIGITLPGMGTSKRTKSNADVLMEELQITSLEISIKAACEQHFKDINHDSSVHDVTFENSQARERTQMLMDYANMHNAMVIGTGDLSELALGWATYNGDHMSMYDVNGSVPKTLIQFMVGIIALESANEKLKKTLLDILDTPISPELIPLSELGSIKQKTEDLVGPYQLHDYFIYNMIKYGYSPTLIYERAKQTFVGEFEPEVIKKWLGTFYRRFFMQQFKRSCSPDGPDVTGVSLSPRGGWLMPSDVTSAIWLKEVEAL